MSLQPRPPLFDGPFIINFFPNDKCHPKFQNALEAWYVPAEFIKKKDGYVKSHLHEAVLKGNWHHCNFAPFTHKNVCCFKTVKDEGWMEIMKNFSNPENIPKPGGFEEVDAYDMSKLSGNNMPKDRPDDTRFILINFDIPEGKEADFEGSWKKSSGMDALAKTAGSDFVNACLYKRWTEFSKPINYVVRAELTNLADKAQTRGAELVKTVQDATNASGINGYANLYKVIVNY